MTGRVLKLAAGLALMLGATPALAKGEQPAGTGDYLQWQCRALKDPATGADLDAKVKIEKDPEYVLRAWAAVLTYLMQDARFLHQ